MSAQNIINFWTSFITIFSFLTTKIFDPQQAMDSSKISGGQLKSAFSDTRLTCVGFESIYKKQMNQYRFQWNYICTKSWIWTNEIKFWIQICGFDILGMICGWDGKNQFMISKLAIILNHCGRMSNSPSKTINIDLKRAFSIETVRLPIHKIWRPDTRLMNK